MNKLDGLFKRTKTKKKHLSHFGTPIHLLLASKVLPLRNDPIEADIPDVLIYLIDYLADDKNLSQEGIFRIAGSVKSMKDIIAEIDQNGPQIISNLGPAPLNCICSILKQWIRDIPESYVGEEIYTLLYSVKDDPEKQLNVFKSIRNPYRNLLIYMCRFLLKIISFESQNKMSKANIAIIFGPNIFKPPESSASNELSISEVEDNFRYIRWLELLLANFNEIFQKEEEIPFSIHDDQELSMYEFLRGNMQDVILDDTLLSESSYSDIKLRSRRSMSVNDRGARSHRSSIRPGINEDQSFSNSRQSIRPISLNLEEMTKLNYHSTNDTTKEESEPDDLPPTVEDNTSSNMNSRSRRRENSLFPSEEEPKNSMYLFQESSTISQFQEPEIYENIPCTESQEEINISLNITCDTFLRPSEQQHLIDPKELNELAMSNNEALILEYQELYNTDPRTQFTIRRMFQILEMLKYGNTSESIPIRSLSESDLSDDSESKRVNDNGDMASQIWTEESPFSNAISRILKIRESEGRPLNFSSMSESQMDREKLVIKKELTRLKEYSKIKDNLTDEEKLMLKRLLCWYKELKALTSSLNKPPETLSNSSEINTSLKYEKQLIKIRLHQYVLDFKKREGRSPTSSKDWERMANDYRRYKELRTRLKEND